MLHIRVYGNQRNHAEGIQELRTLYRRFNMMNGLSFWYNRGQEHIIEVINEEIKTDMEVIYRLI